MEEDTSNKYGHTSQPSRPQRKMGSVQELLSYATALNEKEKARSKKVDNLFDKAVGATIGLVAPKMKEKDKNSLVNAINAFLED